MRSSGLAIKTKKATVNEALCGTYRVASPTARECGETVELAELIRERRAAIIRAIRQEILSAMRVSEQYQKLRSNTDFLMCAVSLRQGLAILTTDNNFAGFERVPGTHIHAPR